MCGDVRWGRRVRVRRGGRAYGYAGGETGLSSHALRGHGLGDLAQRLRQEYRLLLLFSSVGRPVDRTHTSDRRRRKWGMVGGPFLKVPKHVECWQLKLFHSERGSLAAVRSVLPERQRGLYRQTRECERCQGTKTPHAQRWGGGGLSRPWSCCRVGAWSARWGDRRPTRGETWSRPWTRWRLTAR